MLKFLEYNVPIFDTRTNYYKKENELPDRNLLALGCKNGYVIILDIAKIRTFHARFNNHIADITGNWSALYLKVI